MKVLITGGAGFIGSHVADDYLMRGHDVYVIDDLSTGAVKNLEKAKEIGGNRLTFVEDTILNREAMLELIGICDVVLHFAAAVGVEYVLDNPLETISSNVNGTEVVLELCNKFKKRVLIVSTSEVYGKQTHAPLVESDDLVYGAASKWRWSYAATKLIDEFTSLAYFRANKLDVSIVRLFNTVGPRQSGMYGMVIPRFVDQALKGAPLTVYGDGKQSRTFVHVRDVVRAVRLLMEVDVTAGEIVNIGGYQEISIYDLAVLIVEKTQMGSVIERVPYLEAYSSDYEDMPRRVPCTEKAKSLFGWEAEISLDTILMDVISEKRDAGVSGIQPCTDSV